MLREAVTENGISYPEEIAIGYGKLFEATVDFFIIAFTVFLVIKLMNRIRNRAEDPKDSKEKTPKDIELLHRITELLEEQKALMQQHKKTAP